MQNKNKNCTSLNYSNCYKQTQKPHPNRKTFNHINGNLYHYAGNNPVKYIDPDGKFVQAMLVGAFVGAVTGATTNMLVQVAANVVSGQSLQNAIENIDLASIGTAALSGAVTGAITGGVSSISTIKNVVSLYKSANAALNATANMAGTTVGTIIDNATHDKPLSENLIRNNLIAGAAGVASATITQTASGIIVNQSGQKSVVWLETLDQTGAITSLTGNQPIDTAVNNFLKESAVSVGQESLSSMLDN